MGETEQNITSEERVPASLSEVIADLRGFGIEEIFALIATVYFMSAEPEEIFSRNSGIAFHLGINNQGAKYMSETYNQPNGKQDTLATKSRKKQETVHAVAGQAEASQPDRKRGRLAIENLARIAQEAMATRTREAILKFLEAKDQMDEEEALRELYYYNRDAAVDYFFFAVLAGLARKGNALSEAEFADVVRGKYFDAPLQGPRPISHVVERITATIRRDRNRNNRRVRAQTECESQP
jgi:hypothetical protein